jgi:hypothetical protein
VAEDIGLLLVKGGSLAASPYEDPFQKLWSEFARVQIVCGIFGEFTSGKPASMHTVPTHRR